LAGSAIRKVYDCQHTSNLRFAMKRQEGNGPDADSVVNAVFDNTGIIRDFYKDQFNYNSVDNKGEDLIFNVHYSTDYNNAYWDGDEMVFGDGDGVIFTNFANSLDVTGHELTHGVVQYTAKLIYSGQPGALNEHMADVFGVTIRQFNNGETGSPQTANWLVGDSIMGPTLHGQAIRSMKAPGTAYDNPYMGKDPQPAHMKDYYNGAEDDYGVHINSGIPNKVFYLVSIGFNDTLKAASLWFNTLQKMKSITTFKSFKRKALSTATRMTWSGKLPSGSRAIVKNAFKEVGL
jgi:Zn-dependent metalloprotease